MKKKKDRDREIDAQRGREKERDVEEYFAKENKFMLTYSFWQINNILCKFINIGIYWKFFILRM